MKGHQGIAVKQKVKIFYNKLIYRDIILRNYSNIRKFYFEISKQCSGN